MTVYKLFSTYFYNQKGFNWVFYEDWNKKNYWTYKNYLIRISTTKRVLTGFSTKIKIKKITERIKNISELKCNIELEICFKT